MTNGIFSLSSLSLSGILLFTGSLDAQSTSTIEDSKFLLGIEQGYSLYRDRTRYPIIAPFTWMKSACVERIGETAENILVSFLDLTMSINAREIRLKSVDDVKDCSPDSGLVIVFSRSFEEVKSKIAAVNEHLGTEHQFDETDQEEFVGFASIDSVLKTALVVVNWRSDYPDEWNTAILLQELFQAYLGGNDVPWQTEYFSLLHEVNPYPDMGGPEMYSLAWTMEKFRVNPAGLCPVDIFAMLAVSQYVADATAGTILGSPTSRGLINFSWNHRNSLRRDVEWVESEFARFELVLDKKCW